MKKSSKKDLSSSRSNLAANFRHAVKSEIPIGVFWDIENCQVPKGKSALALVHTIRQRFFNGHKEAEFMCVCDISKENKDVIQELNLAQVTVVHVNAISKNAADDKLKQCMRRFVDIHGSPSTVVLISADVNFATDLSDFRHRHKVQIILIHSECAPDPLTTCANELYLFSDIVNGLPNRSPAKSQQNGRTCELLVSDVPLNKDARAIQQRLKQLSDNCGGRVLSVVGSTAVLKFPNADAAQRARKRMDKEDVFGNKISVIFSPRYSDSMRDTSPHNLRSSYSNKSSDSSRESSPIGQNSISHLDLSHHSTRFFEPVQSHSFHQVQPPPDLIQQDHNFTWLPKPLNKDRNELSQSSFSSSLNTNSFSGSGVSSFGRFDSQSKCGLYQPFPQDRSAQLSPIGSGLPSYQTQKSIGRVSPFLMNESSIINKLSHSAASTSSSTFRASSLSPIYSFNKSCHITNTLNSTISNPSYSSQFKRPHSPTMFSPLPQLGSSSSSHYESTSQQIKTESSTFEPIRARSPFAGARTAQSQSAQGIELLVTNLDQSLDINKMKNILFAAFKEHVMVLHISMLIQPDGMFKAIVKLPTLQDAQFAISQLHRRKIGHKRILISYTNGGKIAPLHIIKAEVAALLSDVPLKQMPLFKFRELFENRYHRTISISELYKLNDTVQICDDSSGRMISLATCYRATPSPIEFGDRLTQENLEKPFCERHMPLLESQGWAECDSVYELPDVCISLKALAPKVHTLLDTHQGALPLNSFCTCYEAEFGPLPIAIGSDWTESQKGNVPLEHLVGCIPGVEIARSSLGIKRVQWLENKDKMAAIARSISPALMNPLVLFGREMIDLLKSQIPKCGIPFNKLIPAYHHHFGRQCRVADYGFTKLIDLLEAIPHIIEILGHGQSRLLTLTHKAQIKRFASDLLRVLKSIPSKEMKMSEFGPIYLQCFEKNFDVSHYGVCDIMDLIAECSENLVVAQAENETIISIPKREQTPEEMERTKQFALDVVDLLRYTPSCSLSFNKFIPSYHHHFGRQCRVSYYGFSKLIELLEAIPDILEVGGFGEDKFLSLTQEEKVKVLSERVTAVIKGSSNQSLPISEFSTAYRALHGFALRVEDYGVNSIKELLEIVAHIVKIEDSRDGPAIVLINRTFMQEVCLRLRRLLMQSATGESDITTIKEMYIKQYNTTFDLTAAVLEGLTLKDGKLKLNLLYMLARNFLLLLQSVGGHLPIQNMESEYLDRFGHPCQPALHGYSSISALLGAFPEYFTIKGRRGRKTVFVNQDLRASEEKASGQCFSNTAVSSLARFQQDQDFLLRVSPLDIFSQPIPSVVPSPELRPEPEELEEKNLMGFESPFIFSSDFLTSMSDADKKREHTLPLCHPANSYYYQYQILKDRKSPLTTNIRSCASPAFAPLPPVKWLTQSSKALNLRETIPLPGPSVPLSMASEKEVDSDGSISSPQTKGRPRSRIAAHFAVLEK